MKGVKQMFKVSWMVLVLLCVVLQTRAGDAYEQYQADMKKVTETFAKKHIGVTLHYALYASPEKGLLVQQSNTTMYYWGDLYASSSKDLDFITNEKMTLSADHKQKAILINKSKVSEKKKRLKEMMSFLPDSTGRKLATYTLLESTNKKRTWKIVFQKNVGQIATIMVDIDITAYQLNRMVVEYKNTFQQMYGKNPEGVNEGSKPYLEITYSNYHELKDKNKYFSVNQFISMDKNGKAKLQPAYNSYTLSNYYHVKH